MGRDGAATETARRLDGDGERTVCLHCGAAHDPGHRYCPQCGTARHERRGRLRRRVEVVARNVEDVLWGALGWTLLLIGVVAALLTAPSAAVGTGSLAVGAVIALLGLLLVGLGLLCNPRFGRQLSRRHEPSTFGRVRTVDHRVVRPAERAHDPCAVCGAQFDAGVVRRRRDEFVLAGLPVYTFEVGYNHYCADCAEEHVFAGPAVDADALEATQFSERLERELAEDRHVEADRSSDREPRERERDTDLAR